MVKMIPHQGPMCTVAVGVIKSVDKTAKGGKTTKAAEKAAKKK
ncbi:uncharacterized protein PSFLO_01445 [Pseudozyma flocculosa]|uniref:Uncharacterized protein n=1 Tax=Pseudozyma flocculosa TaxID=84751 RepID=A0A5C3EUF8_9BASI|nr:uncharacterized protein PSFLO_01445 [Pseudozyma flocculosa]